MRSTIKVLAKAFVITFAVAQNTTASTNTTTAAEGILSSGDVDLGTWTDAYAKAVALIAELTNEEKITIITGGSVTSVNWTALEFKDGTQSVQGYDYVTGFSEASTLSMTWDKTLMYNQLKAVALEFYGKGFQVTNGPTSQPLGRTPWGGRLVETLGQDPYLNGIAFGIGAKAFSDAGIVAGGKHFLLNEQETNRQASGSDSDVAPYSSVADDKTLHETYLWSFYDGVKNGLGAVMCAMTKVNGTLSCENEDLLQGLLKTELGFPGLVFPDVGGQTTAFGSANGGLDYGSSSYWTNATLQAGINNGSFTQARLDDMAVRNVIGYFKVGLDNGTQPAYVDADAYVDVRANHSTIVRTNGAASLILLKNTNSALPLSKPKSMALFGSHAGPIMAGPNYIFSVQGSGPTYAGHLAGGSGSGQTSFPYLITPQQSLTNKASLDGTMIRWILNNTYTSTTTGGFGGGTAPSGNSTTSTLAKRAGGAAIAGLSGGTSLSQNIPDYATGAEVCMVFINALSGEGADRTELRNTEQDDLVSSVAENCNNTIVVVNTVGARILDAWIENENVTAVVYGGLLGQESGNSLVDVLYGGVNPSGRLPHTIAKNESDYNVGICETAVCNFTEGNYIDYRYFDKYNVTPRYEFGYGLSYTTFDYSGLSVNITNSTALASTYPTGILAVGGKTDLWDEVISASVTVTNNGTLDGSEVSQLYVAYPDAADQPVRQLRGFEKTLITSGSSATVTFNVRRRDISMWDVQAQDWAVVGGDYVFSVGASSRDLRVSQTVTVGA
ncbi:beta-glucosidase D [Mollisia scopiformis]|uniref:beta-glucosidase n=1 Tax=Mollisia scopiformis TaxID=149040 RepID=A0A194XMV0_MOLSC|nr:beta-glucosidase D [Mollisia scopiformis]KUJ21483.1 beta-glucosidase D [Mollisia scopiformis]